MNDPTNGPIVYQAVDQDYLMALLECGHHSLVAKASHVWIDSSDPLLCEECAGERLLHPLVLLEIDFWQEV